MSRTVAVENAAQMQGWTAHPHLSPFDSDTLRRDGCDLHLCCLQDDVITARCSLWWRGGLRVDDKQVGFIGHFSSCDAAASQRVLEAACSNLAEQGCTLAIGPLDGSTWRRYRLVTERAPEPSFFLEPDNPADWPQHFASAGFSVLASYSSILCDDLQREDPRLKNVEQRLAHDGVTIRTLRMHDIEDELRRIHGVCAASFRRNFLYQHVTEDEFLAQYRAIIPFVKPELVLLAEQHGRLVGFSFSVPDVLQAQRGGAINMVIVKTVAVLPGRAFAGLGNLLAARTHAIAQAMGFTRAVHALIHDDNASRNVSTRYGRTMRRYALFARELGVG
jgi:L-amino acid N-acyltransferase YncA